MSHIQIDAAILQIQLQCLSLVAAIVVSIEIIVKCVIMLRFVFDIYARATLPMEVFDGKKRYNRVFWSG